MRYFVFTILFLSGCKNSDFYKATGVRNLTSDEIAVLTKWRSKYQEWGFTRIAGRDPETQAATSLTSSDGKTTFGGVWNTKKMILWDVYLSTEVREPELVEIYAHELAHVGGADENRATSVQLAVRKAYWSNIVVSDKSKASKIIFNSVDMICPCKNMKKK